jgi:hypothetical protein
VEGAASDSDASDEPAVVPSPAVVAAPSPLTDADIAFSNQRLDDIVAWLGTLPFGHHPRFHCTTE